MAKYLHEASVSFNVVLRNVKGGNMTSFLFNGSYIPQVIKRKLVQAVKRKDHDLMATSCFTLTTHHPIRLWSPKQVNN